DARTGGSRAQHDLARAVTALAVVMQRTGVAPRHADQIAARRLGGLADRLRRLAGLAVAQADAALPRPNDDERGEAEALAALHHLCDAIDMDELVGELAVALFPLPLPSASAPVRSTCHCQIPFIRS